MSEGDLAGAHGAWWRRRCLRREWNQTIKLWKCSAMSLHMCLLSCKRKLRNLLRAGNVASARALMDKLKDTGKADVVHFNVMLLACEGSAEMRRVIETEMPAAGLKPDVAEFPARWSLS